VVGHAAIMMKRKRIDDVLRDPRSSETLKEKLKLVLAVRKFAVDALELPDNDSYKYYVELGRSSLGWNVYAAPELSLKPVEWCFPVAGCIVYKGYHSETAARHFAETLKTDRHDVFVGEITAYSTLGHFDDPVLSTHLAKDGADIAGLLFHELAHQKCYVGDDSKFNEGFAVTVEREGARRWLRSNRQHSALDHKEEPSF
jgi:predicted aminopeptidase